ncbi:hypothetical protein VNI00_010957 [Paramarasmius palmivorus]|uniref:HNH nuclease domain-containing protein n=1 Tax=Paramarasmius palmivorus TaxID=297713 RepID=A0AAW0CEL5_9AGAR
MSELPAANKTKKELIQSRVLGYLILHTPPIALHELEQAIHSCKGDRNALLKLGESFINYFIRPFKKYKGRTPVSSYHSSRSSSDEGVDIMMAEIKEAPKDHREAKRQALIRDGFRCVATGIYDLKAWDVPGMDEATIREAGAVYTRCAHIVPQFGYFNMTIDTEKDFSASVLAVLQCFGYDLSKLDGTGVHSLSNVMTMQYDPRRFFDELKIWFEATEVKDCYCIKTVPRVHYGFLKQKIVFSSTPNLPAPSPGLLALHATCAKVAHFSGAGQHIDELDEDTEGLPVLANDGGSFDILNNALWRSLGSISSSIAS